MPGFSRRGLVVPVPHHAFQSRLHDAKTLSWAGVTGESRPTAHPAAPPRRWHPGVLDDLPFPEGPVRPRRVFPALLRTLVRVFLTGVSRSGPPAEGSEIAGSDSGTAHAPRAIAPPGTRVEQQLPAAA